MLSLPGSQEAGLDRDELKLLLVAGIGNQPWTVIVRSSDDLARPNGSLETDWDT